MIDFRDKDAIKDMILARVEEYFCIDGISMEWGRGWFSIELPAENTHIGFHDGFKLMVSYVDNKHHGLYCEDYLTKEEVQDMFEYSTDGFLFADRIGELSGRLEDKVCKALWGVDRHGVEV